VANTIGSSNFAVGPYFAFLEDGGQERVQDIGALDVRDYLEAAKSNGLSIATLKQHMAAPSACSSTTWLPGGGRAQSRSLLEGTPPEAR
jgi:hypothetical protein